MTPIICDSQSVVPRREWLLCLGMNDPPDVNDSPVMPILKLCSGVTLCMLFITLLTCWTQSGSCVHYYSPAKSDLFYWWLNAIAIPSMDHQMINSNLFARLSTTIHQHPSSYNIKMFWCKCIWCPHPFLSVLEERCGYGGCHGSHCYFRHKCLGSHSHLWHRDCWVQRVSWDIWYEFHPYSSQVALNTSQLDF